MRSVAWSKFVIAVLSKEETADQVISIDVIENIYVNVKIIVVFNISLLIKLGTALTSLVLSW